MGFRITRTKPIRPILCSRRSTAVTNNWLTPIQFKSSLYCKKTSSSCRSSSSRLTNNFTTLLRPKIPYRTFRRKSPNWE